MTVGDVDRSWRTSRLVTINDVYTFEKASGHGGFAAASTLINELRRGHQGDCLVTVNGDFLGGSLLAEQSKGEVVIEILNHIGIDACVLGNHEFDFSTSVLERRIGESKFDWYGANVTKLPENRMLPGCIDRKVVVTRSGLRLGVFGVCTPATPKLSYPCDLTRFHDVIATAKQAVAALQQEGADLIIALTHLRLAADVDLAKECPEVHIVLGGHDHDPFSQLQNGQLVLKCGQNAYWVGVVDIHWRRKDGADGVEFFLSYSMHSTCNTDEDPACIDIVRRCQEKFEPVDPEVDLDEVLVRCTGAQLDTRTSTVRVCEASSGNLVADAMYSFFMAHGAEPDLACINGGFIRGDRLYPEDGVDITRRLLYEEMPFPKHACCIDIAGASYTAAIEQHLSQFPSPAGSFPHFSRSVAIEFDRDLPVGSRITKFTLHGEPIDPNRTYRVATSLFIANCGDGCTAYKDGRIVESVLDRRIPDLVIWMLERYRDQNRPLRLVVEGRVRERQPNTT
ncbi:5'-Nucleotidase C-terminal domain-containing protein [Plasmodiophora brassicae]